MDVRNNYLYLGPNPCEEPCADMDDYSAHRNEVRRYVELLQNIFINMPENAWFSLKREEGSDFGHYFEAVVNYQRDDEDSTAFAFFVESNCPRTWKDTKKLDWKAPKESILRK